MPPKKGNDKKAAQKSQKVVEDKTFGMKNKKGAKAQKFIQTVQKQAQNKYMGNPRAEPSQAEEAKKKKLEEEKKKAEERALFKPVAQTVAKGVDPKSVVCVYFKQGLCEKGSRCKFSHDLAVERKSEKRNIYEDTRETDNMADWDQDKLNEVVNKKHGEDNKKRTTTEIVCKYFLEAVEKKTYGWFWNCPNGDKCMYRHALPPGFVLKSEMKAMEKNKKDEISMEMLVEKERASLGKTVTKVTLESFLAWKKRKVIEKKQEKIMEETKKKSNYKLGLHQGLSGRDLFTFNPDLVGDDDEGADDTSFKRDEDEEGDTGLEVKNIKLDMFEATDNTDDSGTKVTDDRFSYMEGLLKQEKEIAMAAGSDVVVEDPEGEKEKEKSSKKIINDDDLTEKEHEESLKKMISKGDKPTTSKQNKKGLKDPTTNIEIDESLFNADDLDDIEDELEDLEIED